MRVAALEAEGRCSRLGRRRLRSAWAEEDTVSKTNTATTTTERSQEARKHNVRKLLSFLLKFPFSFFICFDFLGGGELLLLLFLIQGFTKCSGLVWNLPPFSFCFSLLNAEVIGGYHNIYFKFLL